MGTTICKQLEDRGIQFNIIDLKPSFSFPDKTHIADIRNIDQLQAAPFGEVIIHLAAVHRDDVETTSLYYDVNVTGTKNILVVMEQKGCDRIVFTSSVAVYGLNNDNANELSNCEPFNHYGRSKLEAENLIRHWQLEKQGNLATIIRPTVIFGVGNRGNVFNLFNQIAQKKFMMIGSGENRKAMAYVENIAAFIIQIALDRPNNHIFNYADTPALTMNELVAQVHGRLHGPDARLWKINKSIGLLAGRLFDLYSWLTGKNLPISHIRVKKFMASSTFDTDRTEQIFKPFYPLPKAIEKTLEAEFISEAPVDEIFYTE